MWQTFNNQVSSLNEHYLLKITTPKVIMAKESVQLTTLACLLASLKTCNLHSFQAPGLTHKTTLQSFKIIWQRMLLFKWLSMPPCNRQIMINHRVISNLMLNSMLHKANLNYIKIMQQEATMETVRTINESELNPCKDSSFETLTSTANYTTLWHLLDLYPARTIRFDNFIITKYN